MCGKPASQRGRANTSDHLVRKTRALPESARNINGFKDNNAGGSRLASSTGCASTKRNNNNRPELARKACRVAKWPSAAAPPPPPICPSVWRHSRCVGAPPLLPVAPRSPVYGIPTQPQQVAPLLGATAWPRAPTVRCKWRRRLMAGAGAAQVANGCRCLMVSSSSLSIDARQNDQRAGASLPTASSQDHRDRLGVLLNQDVAHGSKKGQPTFTWLCVICPVYHQFAARLDQTRYDAKDDPRQIRLGVGLVCTRLRLNFEHNSGAIIWRRQVVGEPARTFGLGGRLKWAKANCSGLNSLSRFTCVWCARLELPRPSRGRVCAQVSGRRQTLASGRHDDDHLARLRVPICLSICWPPPRRRLGPAFMILIMPLGHLRVQTGGDVQAARLFCGSCAAVDLYWCP